MFINNFISICRNILLAGYQTESYPCGQVRTNKSDNPIWRPQSWKGTKLDLQ